MKKQMLRMLFCLCMAMSLLAAAALAVGQFTDVKSGDYFATPVEWAVEQAITNGTSDTTFSPNQTCTRAQIITFLWRAAGCPDPGDYYDTFSPYFDLDKNAYCYKAACWATDTGIITIEGVYFEGNTPCTRAAAVEYIWRYAKSPKAAEVSFSDVKAGTGTAKAVSWAVGYGVTNGTGGTTFSPNETCTRGQIVTFLHRYFVEPLQATPAPAPTPTPAPTDSWKLDPLPPADYKKHPDWYMSLTPVGEMSNAQLVAESDSIAAVIADYRARDAYITDSMLVRKDDIMYQIMERAEIVRRYDQAVEYNKKYGLKIDQSDIDDYENLVAKWGDPELLRGN